MILFLRKVLGYVSRLVAPTYGCCRKCGVAWKFTNPVSVMLNDFEGFNFLCVYCYPRTKPAERLVYFRPLYCEWIAYGADRDLIEYERAILRQI